MASTTTSASRSQKSRRELARNFAASSLTGAVTMLATNWIDCLRIRWQAHGLSAPEQRTGLTAYLRGIARSEGVWHGLQKHALATNIVASTISMGTRIGLYPMARDLLGAKPDTGHQTALGRITSTAKMVTAGVGSGMCGYWVASPLFMVKVQLQSEAGVVDAASGLLTTGAAAGRAPTYKHGWGGVCKIVRERGPLALWSGAGWFTLRGGTFSGSQLAAYDGTKSLCIGKGWMADGPALHVAASVVASFSLSTAVMPLDNIITMFQASKILTNTSAAPAASTPLGTARLMYQQHGVPVFFRGWSAMFSRMLPTSVATFYIYEFVRSALGLNYLD
ncbi:Mitochondrial oxaloacetate transport protein [Diplonema papillatum]|nr:Mitochondrial oxaloacetate transport protein [Diplonema papillatum]|eukprot:gene4715-7243_t